MNFLTGSYIGRGTTENDKAHGYQTEPFSATTTTTRERREKREKERREKAERWKHKKCQRITSNFQWIRPVQGITPAGRFLCDDGVGQEYDRFAICARARRTGIQRFSAHSDSLVSSRAKIELFRRATFSLSFSSTLVFARALQLDHFAPCAPSNILPASSTPSLLRRQRRYSHGGQLAKYFVRDVGTRNVA